MSVTLSKLIEQFCYDSAVINSAEFVEQVKSLVESGADVDVDICPDIESGIKDNALIYFLGAYYEIKRESDFPTDSSHVEDLIYYFLDKNASVTTYAIAMANHYEDIHMLEEFLKRSTEPHYQTTFTNATLAVFEGFGVAPADYDLTRAEFEPSEDDDEDDHMLEELAVFKGFSVAPADYDLTRAEFEPSEEDEERH
jgi:hypothetical protein